MKPPPKCSSKANNKKTSIRQRKEKTAGLVADRSPAEPEATASDAEDTDGRVEPQMENCSVQEHKVFQRTLSPADILHVHSYAKGDYGEDMVAQEEGQTVSSDDKNEDIRPESREVLASLIFTQAKCHYKQNNYTMTIYSVCCLNAQFTCIDT